MFKEPTRNHWISIIGGIAKSISEMMFLAILLIINLKDNGLLIVVGFLGLSVIFGVLKWVTTNFYIDGEELVYNTGVINKKKIEIPFNKINTVDTRIGLLDRLFDICTVKVDSGATEDGQEIKLKITKLEAQDLKNAILVSKKEESEEEQEVTFERKELIKRTITFKELMIYALTKGKLAWAFGGFFVITEFIQQADEIFETSFLDSAVSSINFDKLLGQDKMLIILGLIGVFMFSYLLICLIFIVYESIRLYNFTLSSDGKNIYIKYGAITTKEYSIPIEKIHALKYKQGFLQQMLNVYNLEAVTIGYGDEQNEKAVLFPIANNKFLEETIIKLLPQFEANIEMNKPPKRAISRFIIKRNIVLLCPVTAFLIFNYKELNGYYFAGAVALIVINTILGFINYKNTSLGFNETTIVGSSGSVVKTTTIIKQSSVQSMEVKTGPFHKRKKVFDVQIGIYTNNFGQVVSVKNISEELEGQLKESLIY
ncbi:MAG: PH domain-containing protein [Clostridium sp.]